MRPILIAGAFALALAGVAGAQTMHHSGGSHQGALSSSRGDASAALPTPDYMTAAGQSDQFEIQEGQLASKMAKSPSIQNFGRMMVTEHTKTTDMMMKTAKDAGMSPPPPPPLRADQQAMIDQLRGTSGADFDRTYVQQQLASHQEALMLHANYAAGGSDPHFKKLATNTVPVVQGHLRNLQALQGKVGSNSSS